MRKAGRDQGKSIWLGQSAGSQGTACPGAEGWAGALGDQKRGRAVAAHTETALDPNLSFRDSHMGLNRRGRQST